MTTPLIRENGEFREATWDEALDLIAERLVNYRDDDFGTLCSAKATNEDGYIQQKFARLLMQTNNIDHCTRLCHSPSVEAMLATLGSGATSNSYTDYEDAGCLVVIGCDPTSNHPVAASRMRRAVVERGAKLIVINPRRIDMCDYADLWLRPYPGTDVALLNGMAWVVLDEGLVDEEFVANRTEDYDQWARVIQDLSRRNRVEEITSVSAEDLKQAARLYAQPPFPARYVGCDDDKPYAGSCLIWGMGITQHVNGTPNAHGLLNLALVTGQLGRPGSGVSPPAGPEQRPGLRRRRLHPRQPARLPGLPPRGPGPIRGGLGRPAPARHPRPGHYPDRPVHRPGPRRPGHVYHRREPPAQRAGPERGRRTVQEPRVPGGAGHLHARDGPDCRRGAAGHQLCREGRHLHPTANGGCSASARPSRPGETAARTGRLSATWAAACAASWACPWRTSSPTATPRRFSTRWPALRPSWRVSATTAWKRKAESSGPAPRPTTRARPTCTPTPSPAAPGPVSSATSRGPLSDERPSRRYPLVLNTGRTLYHWHGGTITRRVSGLLARAPELEVSINPADGEKYGIIEGQAVRVTSRRGELTGKALFTDRMRPGKFSSPSSSCRSRRPTS